MCVAYEHEGEKLRSMPYHQSVFHDVTPVYVELPGWRTDLSACTEARELPREARDYLELVEHEVGRARALRRHRPGPRAVRAALTDAGLRRRQRGAGARAGRGARADGRRRGDAWQPRHPRLDAARRPRSVLRADLYVIGPEVPLVDGSGRPPPRRRARSCSARAPTAPASRARRRG